TEAAEEEETIDLETYKRLQAERRALLPSFVAAGGPPKALETEQQLAAEGYVRLGSSSSSSSSSSSNHPDPTGDRPKKKSINLYEYVYIEAAATAAATAAAAAAAAAAARWPSEHEGVEGTGARAEPRRVCCSSSSSSSGASAVPLQQQLLLLLLLRLAAADMNDLNDSKRELFGGPVPNGGPPGWPKE
ncbi:nuclear RNA binding protein, putative, partial [Eimeria necatrix]